MKNKYNELYDKHLVQGKDVEAMKTWGEMDKKEFHYLAEKHPELASRFLEAREVALEANKWNNFLSHDEAKRIISSMSPKAVWSIEDIKEAVKQLGVLPENAPKWNFYSLAVAMNMIYSDHRKSIDKHFKDSTTLVSFVYEQAVELLEDEDKIFRIREYFEDVID